MSAAAGTSQEAPPIDGDVGRIRQYLEQELGAAFSFDVIFQDLTISGRDALIAAIDGFIKDDVLLRIVQGIQWRDFELEEAAPAALNQVRRRLSYTETATVDNLDDAIDRILAGPSVLFVEGLLEGIVLDTRTYPSRGPDEPDLEKVLRGPRDGFTETLTFNTALIRRRVRDRHLRNRLFTVGSRSQTDVTVMYLEDVAHPALVDEVVHRLEQIEIGGVPMAEKSIGEFLMAEKPWWNPFPTVRYTERPDVAAVHLLEGHVVVAVDTTPVVLILPATFFHHLQHAEEFHETPSTGMMTRWFRILGMLTNLLLVPLWLVLAQDPTFRPDWLDFLGPREQQALPLFVQFLIAAFGFELIRLGLIHTPTALATSLGLIGAVLLGELAVEVGLFAGEVILYVIVTALGNFVIPTHDLKRAIQQSHYLLLLLAGLAGLPGLLAGLLGLALILASSASLGVPYLWPLYPFDAGALLQVLIRYPVTDRLSRPPYAAVVRRSRQAGREGTAAGD